MQCVHFWDLSDTVEEVTHGVCRKCGDERDFIPTRRKDVGDGRSARSRPRVVVKE